jgi:hypothetical protein
MDSMSKLFGIGSSAVDCPLSSAPAAGWAYVAAAPGEYRGLKIFPNNKKGIRSFVAPGFSLLPHACSSRSGKLESGHPVQ